MLRTRGAADERKGKNSYRHFAYYNCTDGRRDLLPRYGYTRDCRIYRGGRYAGGRPFSVARSRYCGLAIAVGAGNTGTHGLCKRANAGGYGCAETDDKVGVYTKTHNKTHGKAYNQAYGDLKTYTHGHLNAGADL